MADGMFNPRFADLVDETSLANTEIPMDPFAEAEDELKEVALDGGVRVRVNREGFLETTPDGEYRETSVPDDGGYLAVNPDWLEEQWKMLSRQPWFRGNSKYTRDDAYAELIGEPSGTFVVRASISQPGHYAISAKSRFGDVHSMLILPSWAGPNSNAPGQTQYRLGSKSTLVFNTIVKLVKYYSEHSYHKGDRLVGVILPETQKGGYVQVKPGEFPGGGVGDGYMSLAPTGVAGRMQQRDSQASGWHPGDGGYFPVAPTHK